MNKRKSLTFKDILQEQYALQKILYWFFSYPYKEISLRDLCAEVEITKTTANRLVTQLVHDGFLQVDVLGRTWRIKANQEHYYFRTVKIPYNLMQIYQSNIIEEVLRMIPGAKAVILFGSYRKGDDTEQSDIDIAVEVLGEKELKIEKLGVIAHLGYRINVPVNVHVFSRKKIDLNLFANIANGIVLHGFLEVHA